MAENRASKPGGAGQTRCTRTSGGSNRASRRTAVSSPAAQRAAETSQCATWPRACTPTSVRPATVSAGSSGRRSTRASALSRVSCTVRWPGWRAHPEKPEPSYPTSSRTRMASVSALLRFSLSGVLVRLVFRAGFVPGCAGLIRRVLHRGVVGVFGHVRGGGVLGYLGRLVVGKGSLLRRGGGRRPGRRGLGAAGAAAARWSGGRGLFLDQLDDGERSVVTLARPDLGDSRVAALAGSESWADLGEQGMHDALVGDHGEHLAPGVQVTPLGEGDQALCVRPQPPRLRLGRGDLAMLEQGGGEVRQDVPLMGGPLVGVGIEAFSSGSPPWGRPEGRPQVSVLLGLDVALVVVRAVVVHGAARVESRRGVLEGQPHVGQLLLDLLDRLGAEVTDV